MKCGGIVFLSTLLFAVTPAKAAPPIPDQASIAALERTVPALMRQAKVPGLSLALVKDGKVYWRKAFGMKMSMELDTRYDVRGCVPEQSGLRLCGAETEGPG